MPTGKRSSGQRRVQKRRNAASARSSNSGRYAGSEAKFQDVLVTTKTFPVIAPNREQLGGFPATKKVRLKYVSNIILNGETSTSNYVFQLNGMYDPDITSTGHQPSNFDVWSVIYDKWCVTDSSFTMQWCSQETSSSVSYYGFLITENSSAISTSTATNWLMEQPYGMYSATPGGDVYSTQIQGPLRARVPIHTWFACSRRQLVADPTCRGNVSANPTRPLYAIMWASPVNGGTGNGVLNFRIEIEFDAVFVEPATTVFSLARNPRQVQEPERKEGLVVICDHRGVQTPFCPDCGKRL